MVTWFFLVTVCPQLEKGKPIAPVGRGVVITSGDITTFLPKGWIGNS